MSRDVGVPTAGRRPPLTNPWPFLLAGLAAALTALVLNQFEGAWPAFRALAVAAAVALALAGIVVRLRVTTEEVDDRFRTAGVIALAAAAPFLGLYALDNPWDSAGWDSAGLLLQVMFWVGLAAALLILLPQLARRLTLVVLVIFHFGGMLSAVLSVAPPNSAPSWLVSKLWVRVYRPYLQFMYLNNAYHFYSPEPGPPCLLWFKVEYEDGTSQWVTVPDQGDSPTRLNFQRRLALTESTNLLNPQSAEFLMRLKARRDAADFGPLRIPLYHKELPENMQMQEAFQYREPMPYSKLMVSSYARHVAHAYPHKGGVAVKKVKVYRVVHNIPNAPLLLHLHERGLGITDPTQYSPYFQGDFDSEGRLLNEQDPYLYWLIPILRVPADAPQQSPVRPGVEAPVSDKLLDYLSVHAGDSPTP